MPWVPLRALWTRFPAVSGNLSKKTTAILRPKASPSWPLCSWPARVLFSATYRNADGVAGDLVHEALGKDSLDVVAPGDCEGSTRGSRSLRSIHLQQVPMFS